VLSLEVTGPEAQAVFVESDQGQLGGRLAAPAPGFAIDKALRMIKRPSVIFRHYLDLFPGQYIHGASPAFANALTIPEDAQYPRSQMK
jgi:hypothetical protein